MMIFKGMLKTPLAAFFNIPPPAEIVVSSGAFIYHVNEIFNGPFNDKQQKSREIDRNYRMADNRRYNPMARRADPGRVQSQA
jgi:hypothetical protein